MDRPGFGLSSPIAYRADTFGRLTADLQRQVLDGLAIKRVDVVGHSIGAAFALRFALQHPERVRRVILLGAGPIMQEAGVPTPIRLVGSPLGAVMLRLMKRRGMVLSMIRGSGHGAARDRAADADAVWHRRLVGTPAIWQRVIDSLPNGQLTVMDGAGHMVWLDDPTGVARRTESFLSN
jgi:pimeloyl-ACP methyl ester carboxylesterase